MPAGSVPTPWAIVLTGGAGRRLGGVDKAAIEVGGRRLLDTVIGGVRQDAPTAGVVVVGVPRPTEAPVRWTREHPLGAGPAAGLAAGLGLLDARATHVLALAVDLPHADALLAALMSTGTPPPGVSRICVDPAGRRQWLASWYDVPLLRASVRAHAAQLEGLALRSLLAPLGQAPGQVEEVAVSAEASADIDTPEDLARYRAEGPISPPPRGPAA